MKYYARESENVRRLVDMLYTKGPMTCKEIRLATGWTESVFIVTLTSASYLYDLYEIEGSRGTTVYGVNKKIRIDIEH